MHFVFGPEEQLRYLGEGKKETTIQMSCLAMFKDIKKMNRTTEDKGAVYRGAELCYFSIFHAWTAELQCIFWLSKTCTALARVSGVG